MVLADTGESAQRYMANGAHGVVYRNVTSPALVDCVRKVARGETWVQDVAVPSELTENDMVGLRVRDRLTAKELRIVALIVQGYKNKEIASQLGTTEQVIKNYLRNVYDKIGVSDRLELALFTIHHRILNEAAAATARDQSAAGWRRRHSVNPRKRNRKGCHQGSLFYCRRPLPECHPERSSTSAPKRCCGVEGLRVP